jgi:hypothetical protein
MGRARLQRYLDGGQTVNDNPKGGEATLLQTLLALTAENTRDPEKRDFLTDTG